MSSIKDLLKAIPEHSSSKFADDNAGFVKTC